jgi:hypothetical protein
MKLPLLKKYKTLIIITSILIGLVLGFFFLRKCSTRSHLQLNEKTLKCKLKPSLFEQEHVDDELLFEPADIDYYNNTPIHLYDQIQFNHVDNLGEIGNYDLNEIDHDNLNNNEIGINEPTVEINRVDTQNVHDATVNKYIRNIFSGVDVENDNAQVIHEIKCSIKHLSNEKRDKIIKVLNKIQSRNSNISNLGDIHELSVLNTVWQNAKTNKNIKDMMFQQLVDSIEHGNVVCPTGIVNRLTIALAVETPEILPKTKSQLNEEIFNKAIMVRDELETNENYNELDETSQKAEFKNTLVNTLENDYIGILTKHEINENIKDWIDYI